MSDRHLLVSRALVVVVVAVLLMEGVGRLMQDEQASGIAAKNETKVGVPHAMIAGDTAKPTLPELAKPEAETSNTEPFMDKLQPEGAIPNVALLTFKNHAALDAFLKRAASEGLVVTGRLDKLNAVRVAYESLDKLKRDLREHAGDYAGVWANFPVAAPGLPTPENRGVGGDQPFGSALLSSIGAGPGVDRTAWGQGVTVAVIDSGVTNHPTFVQGQVQHVDLVNDGKAFEGHGTAIASLIAGGLEGAQGVAPAAKILDVRIADSSGGSDSFQLARGIQAAMDRGVQVINISMGSYGDSPLVAQAIQDAIAKGVIVVASAGNEKSSTKTWPAAYPGVVSVSGVDATGQLAYFSNTGDPTLAAPGVGVPSAYAQDSKPLLAQGDGTSQAAALVSGAAAAIRSAGGDVISVLTNNAAATSANAHQVGAGVLMVPRRLR